MRTDKIAVREKHLAERHVIVRVRMRAVRIRAGIDSPDTAEQHMHTRRKQNCTVCIMRHWCAVSGVGFVCTGGFAFEGAEGFTLIDGKALYFNE